MTYLELLRTKSNADVNLQNGTMTTSDGGGHMMSLRVTLHAATHARICILCGRGPCRNQRLVVVLEAVISGEPMVDCDEAVISLALVLLFGRRPPERATLKKLPFRAGLASVLVQQN